MQLDSWWYPKGSTQSWSDTNGGFYTYEAHKDLFPNGLAAFRQSLGAGLITHNRWLDLGSPYRSQYKVSGNTVIDPAFWADRAAYLKAAGVMVYEQDWLARNGLPNQNNLTDQEAFLDSMAEATVEAVSPTTRRDTRLRRLLRCRTSSVPLRRANAWFIFLLPDVAVVVPGPKRVDVRRHSALS